jgi:biotin transport system substrate-specific component
MTAAVRPVPAPQTLADALFSTRRSRTLMGDVFLILGANVLMAALAQVSIHLPFTPVPITGQTFGVLFTGMALGSRRGAIAMALYLLEGACGMPIFADGTFGFLKFVGPTAGYLWSYPLAAALTGYLAERGWDRKPLGAAAAMALGSLFILTAGTLFLSVLVGSITRAFLLGAAPFLIGELVKTMVATILLPSGWAIVRRARGE